MKTTKHTDEKGGPSILLLAEGGSLVVSHLASH